MNAPTELALQAEVTPLHRMPTGQWAIVQQVLPNTKGEEDGLTLRLTEIGFIPGEVVRIMARGFAGRDPLAVRVGHTTFAMRSHEAARVRVTPEGARHAD